MKKKLYVVLGKSNSHKSSVIRCLSGCRDTRGDWEISMKTSKEIFYVSITSPQERNQLGVSPTDFVNILLKRKESNILLALQSISNTRQPNGDVYFKAFIKAGFKIETIACFDDTANMCGLAFESFNTNDIPSNVTAGYVRKLWQFI